MLGPFDHSAYAVWAVAAYAVWAVAAYAVWAIAAYAVWAVAAYIGQLPMQCGQLLPTMGSCCLHWAVTAYIG